MIMAPDAADLSRQRLLPVFSTHDELEARLVQGLLHASGIESVMNSEAPPSLFPLRMGRMGKLDILVLESQAEEASRIISEQQESGWETGG